VTTGRQEGASARKLLRVLLAFDPARPEWSVADLADQVGVPLSSAYRYVGLLREEGLLETVPGREGRYRLGLRAAGLGRAAERDGPLVLAARVHLAAVRDAVDETVVLARRAGSAVVVLDRLESRQPGRLPLEVGQALTARAGAAARVLLAHTPERRRHEAVAALLPGLGPEAAALLADDALARVRESGWAESYDEGEDGVWACAAAVRLDGSGGVAAISVSGPLFRLGEGQRRAAIAAVRQAADALARDAPARDVG